MRQILNDDGVGQVNDAGEFFVSHVVRWGDCDPARIVYTPRILEYALEALEAFVDQVLGYSWANIIGDRGLSTPMVDAHIAFKKAMRPGDLVITKVRIDKISGSTITYGFAGENRDGETLYEATIVNVFVDDTRYKAVPIPDDIRQRATDYMAAP